MTVRDEYGLVPKVNGLTFDEALQQDIEGARPLTDFIAQKYKYITKQEWQQLAEWLQPLRRRRGHPAGRFPGGALEREVAGWVRRLRAREYPNRKRLPPGARDELIDRAIKLVPGLKVDHRTKQNIRHLLKAPLRFSLKRYRLKRLSNSAP